MVEQLLEWEDHKVYGIGQEKARRLSVTYDSLKQAQSSQTPPWQMSLNGFWHFNLSSMPQEHPKRFYENGFTVSDWDSIYVPGVWQLQGYEALDNTRIIENALKSSFHKKDGPKIDSDMNAVGAYKRAFALPPSWKDRMVYLRFEGVRSAFFIWINGKKVGFSKSAMPVEFRIDPFLRFGEKNDIAVEVYQLSDGVFLEDPKDQYLSGIFGDVTLHAEHRLHIWDFTLQSEITKDGEGRIKVEFDMMNTAELSQAVEVTLLLGEDLADLDQCRLESCRFEAKSGQITEMSFNCSLESPRLWSVDTPVLYHGALVIKDFKGQFTSVKYFRHGFRTVETKSGRLLVNGEPICLKGVVYRAFDQSTGYTLSPERYESDLKIMKTYHINAIRTNSFPNAPYFYDLCDRMGFYVLDEGCVSDRLFEQRPGDQLAMWQDQICDRLSRMVARDRFHPSVIIWGMGDVGRYSDTMLLAKRVVQSGDPTRPVFSPDDEQLRISDFFGREHVSLAFLDAVGDGVDFVDQNVGKTYKSSIYRGKPALLSAYAPARENGLGNLAGYMMRFMKYDNWCGGFIDGFCETVLNTEEAGPIAGLGDANRRAHPSAFEVQKVYQDFEFVLKDMAEYKIEIIRHQLFCEAKSYRLNWEILEDGEVFYTGTPLDILLQVKTAQEVQLPAGHMDMIEGAEYHLNLYLYDDEDDPEPAAWEQFGISSAPVQRIKTKTNSPLKIHDKKIKAEVVGDGFCVRVSKLTGDLTSLVYDGIEFLISPIRLNFSRAATDSDLLMQPVGFFAKRRMANWKKSSQTYRLHSVTMQDLDGEVVITVRRKVKYIKGCAETQYRIDGNGSVFIKNSVMPKRNMVKFGTTMEIGGDYHCLEWFGRGQQENYWDRQSSTKVGVYNLDLQDYVHDYTRPQENSNRTDIRWFSTTSQSGDGLRFEDCGQTLLNVSAWPYHLEDLEEANHYKALRMRETMTLNIDYKQQGIAIDEHYEKEAYRLVKNVMHTFEYKVSRIY